MISLVSRFPLRSSFFVVCFIPSILFFGSCSPKKSTDSSEKNEKGPENQLATAPTVFLRSQSHSDVNWQNWNAEEVFNLATREKKFVFAIFGTPKRHSSKEFIDNISRDPRCVKLLNENFIPLLIDVDAFPEMGILCLTLSASQRQSIGFPFVLILSPDGDPVTWSPASGKALEVPFRNLDNTVSLFLDTLRKNRDFLISNSRKKSEDRLGKITQEVDFSRLRDNFSSRKTLHSLISLYNPTTKSVDNTGGLVPSALISYFVAVSRDPFLAPKDAANAMNAADAILSKILKGAILDPLDGGLFRSRTSNTSWNYPTYTKDLATQAVMISALSRFAESSTQKEKKAELLRIATKLISFCEKTFQKKDGLFASCSAIGSREIGPTTFFWKQDDLQSILTEDELLSLTESSAINPIGNVGVTSDSTRKLFTYNSLRAEKSANEVAETLHLPKTQVDDLLTSAYKKLTTIRQSRLKENQGAYQETTAYAADQAQMANAYLLYYLASEDPLAKENGLNLLRNLKKIHHDQSGVFYRIPPANQKTEEVIARSIDCALTAKTCLLAYRITLDQQWATWAQDLIQTVLSRKIDGGRPLFTEQPDSKKNELTTIFSQFMIFGPSTKGVFPEQVAWLALLRGSDNLATIAHKLRLEVNARATRAPHIYTDYLTSNTRGIYAPFVILNGSTNDLIDYQKVLNSPKFRIGVPFVLRNHLDSLNSKLTLHAVDAEKASATLFYKGKVVKECSSANELTSELLTILRSQ